MSDLDLVATMDIKERIFEDHFVRTCESRQPSVNYGSGDFASHCEIITTVRVYGEKRPNVFSI